MKKVLVILFVLLAVFALASCKQDPKPAEQTPDPTPDPTPGTTEPTTAEIIAAIVEPEWEAGVLRVKSAEDATNEKQPNKFQFVLNKSVTDGQAIEFKAKFTDNASTITVRKGEGDYARFINDTSVYDLVKDDDGWYTVSVPADGVVACGCIGFTLYVETGTWASSFIAIKGLKIGGEDVDITALDEDADIVPFVSAPSELDVLIVRPAAT